jgi:hypothetical protein
LGPRNILTHQPIKSFLPPPPPRINNDALLLTHWLREGSRAKNLYVRKRDRYYLLLILCTTHIGREEYLYDFPYFTKVLETDIRLFQTFYWVRQLPYCFGNIWNGKQQSSAPRLYIGICRCTLPSHPVSNSTRFHSTENDTVPASIPCTDLRMKNVWYLQ